MPESLDVVVVGGGQAGLAAGYFLRRTSLSFAILDASEASGGAWRQAWDSLTLFSSRVAAQTTWLTERGPVFLPDDVDGRALFERARARWLAEREGRPALPLQGGLGDVVAVQPVREARARGALSTRRPYARLTSDGAVWADRTTVTADAIIWCTGSRPALSHLAPLLLVGADGRIAVDRRGRAIAEPRLWLLGYGDQTGMASATLAGVTRAAREAVATIAQACT